MNLSLNSATVINGYAINTTLSNNVISIQLLNKVIANTSSPIVAVPLAIRPITGQIYPR